MNDSRFTIGPYHIIETIAENYKSIIYRGRLNDESETVIIKSIKREFPSPSDVARIRQEHRVIQSLDSDSVVRSLAVIETGNRIALVLEDTHGVSLKEVLLTTKFNVKTYLMVAIRLARIIGDIHHGNIIHRDIKPQNIIMTLDGGRLSNIKITDFGISAILDDAIMEIYNPNVIEGTLPYISPEQTGRMNLPVDYRSDLYSLGVTLYEIITGSVPFRYSDPLELIHAQIAKEPSFPRIIAGRYPAPLLDIVMKLLSKSPEDRYQSAYGLKTDLEFCLRQLEEEGAVAPFELGRYDIAEKFHIPQRIIGRENEIAGLMAAFERVSGGASELMLVTGAPGIGKTMLVQEIHKPIVAKRGHFLPGKYNQFRKDIPYSAIIQAFQLLVRQILTEGEDRKVEWRSKLIDVLGNNGRVITNVIPEIEFIIGEQPDVPDLPSEESQNRFNIVIKNFIGVLARKEHPLVLFLDDFQWADQASCNLIRLILSSRDLRYLLIICAYRENLATGSHPAFIMLDELRNAQVPIESIALPPLTLAQVGTLVGNALRSSDERSAALAEIIHLKTSGNPFFINQFLKTLHDEKLLAFDTDTGWRWDREAIAAMNVTENVVELMAGKIGRLSKRTQRMLKICSCIGNRFDLEMLAGVSGRTIDEALADIGEAIDEGLISYFRDSYRFLHDRIQEAAYSLIPPDTARKVHLKIGTMMLEQHRDRDLSKVIFYIADQMNMGEEFISGADERTGLAGLNLAAGKKAKSSAAYASAVKFLSKGMDLLPDDAWERHYDLTYGLYLERFECEYLINNFRGAELLFKNIIAHARSKPDKANAYLIMINLLTTMGRLEEAINTGVEGLKVFGIRFPSRPGRLRVLIEVVMERATRGFKNIRSFINLPENRDPDRLAIINLVVTTGTPAYYSNTNLFGIICLRGTRYSIRYGNSRVSPFPYMAVATIVGSALGDYRAGAEFAEMALALNDKFDNRELRAKLHLTYPFFVRHWTLPARGNIEYSRRGYADGLEGGDIMYAGHCVNVTAMNRVIIGDNLDLILEEYARYRDFMYSLKDPFITNNYRYNTQMILALKGLTRGPSSLHDQDYDEPAELAKIREEGNPLDLFFFQSVKMRILHLNGEFDACLRIAVEMRKNIEVPLGTLHVAEFYFIHSLALAAKYHEMPPVKRALARLRLRLNQRRMRKWASLCRENFSHKYLLVEAERARLAGRPERAMRRYDEAILGAEEGLFTQNAAIAGECAGRFYLSQGMERVARHYIAEAYRCHVRWGAVVHARRLSDEFPSFITRTADTRTGDDTVTGTSLLSSGSSTRTNIDISTIMKASNAIAVEIDIARLLKRLMNISIENAGAQRGFLILENESDGRLCIEAAGSVDRETDVLQSIPVDRSDELSGTIVNYVNSTKELVVLSDAHADGLFITDPYIEKNKVKSVLCAPIMHKGKIEGICYLENNLTANAFTPDRIELLGILSSQAAIAIENARLLAAREGTARLEREMEIAVNIQTALLPREPRMKGYEITAFMQPASNVGGDYYDVLNLPGRDWLFIGDVAGHGVPSGLVMMMVQTAIHVVLSRQPDISPAELITALNVALGDNIRKISDDKYMTITALAVTDGGSVTYAGLHLDLLIFRSAAGDVESVGTDGKWIGVPENFYPDDLSSLNGNVTLRPGDVLLLHTDGVTEARGTDGAMFGTERLAGILRASGTKPTREIRDAVLVALDGYEKKDDVTLLIVRRNT